MRRLLWAGGLLLLGLATAEVALRLTGVGRGPVTADAVIGYRLTPGFAGERVTASGEHVVLRSNNLGLRRDTPTTPEKPPGATRVLLLGDAQTEGAVENEATYAALLERRLRGRNVGAVEVLNAGVRGYSPLLEYLWLRERGAALRPDVVVMALDTGDDLGELVARPPEVGSTAVDLAVATMQRAPGSWEILRPGAPRLLVETDHWLRSRVRLYALVRGHVGPAAAPNAQLAQAAGRCRGCLAALWQPWLAQTHTGLYDLAPLALRDVLERFARLARQIGARPVIAILPTKLEVEGDEVREQVEETQRFLALRTPPATFAQAERTQILAAAAARQLEVLDLLPALQQASAEGNGPLYDAQDWQLTRLGHAAVARALEPRLAELARRR